MTLDDISHWLTVAATAISIAGACGLPFAVRSWWKSRRRAAMVAEQMQQVFNALSPNGGTSVVDVIRRIEDGNRVMLRRVSNLILVSPTALFEANDEGRWALLNPAATQLFGLDSTAMEGHGWLQAVASHQRSEVQKQWVACVRDGSPFYADCEIHPKGGDHRLVRICATPDESGSYAGSIQIL